MKSKTQQSRKFNIGDIIRFKTYDELVQDGFLVSDEEKTNKKFLKDCVFYANGVELDESALRFCGRQGVVIGIEPQWNHLVAFFSEDYIYCIGCKGELCNFTDDLVVADETPFDRLITSFEAVPPPSEL